MLFTGKGILLTDNDILSRFKKHLERATHIHIATAWATPGLHLDALGAAVQENGLKVCAVVGTHNNATHPAALERLKKLGKLRLAGNEALFHPKMYVFEFRSGKSVAWDGSANFTRAGFGDSRYGGGNVEIVYETDDVEPFLKWFDQQWKQAERATGNAIDDYRRRYERKPPNRASRELVGELKWTPVLDPEEISDAFDQMRETLIGKRVKGRRVGNGEGESVYWRANPGYWCAFGRRRYGHWIPFGPENPRRANQLGNGCLQINPPFDGHSKVAGSYHGLFIRNDSGDIFLARDLTGIRKRIRNGRGVVDPEGLEEGLKKRLPGSVFDVPWKKRPQPRRMVVLGEVGSGELRDTVAELVKLVAELKGGAGEAP